MRHHPRFKTADFAIANECGYDWFDLVITRVISDGKICWNGLYEAGDQWLIVTGGFMDSSQAGTQSLFV